MSPLAPSSDYKPPRHAVLLAVGAAFLLGLTLGGTIKTISHSAALVQRAFAAATANDPPAADPPIAKRLDPTMAYPAEVLRVIDGDTFAARVRVWPGLDVETKVRLRGIDAAELHARCAEELSQAEAARAALQNILADGGVTISRVGVDKYGGRVDALAATRVTPMCPRQCSLAAGRGLMKAAGGKAGAGDRNQESGFRDQKGFGDLMPDA